MKTWDWFWIIVFVLAIVGVCVYGVYHAWSEKQPKNAETAEYNQILANNDQVLFVVVVKKGDDIFVLNEGTKKLLFEFNSAKPADAVDYKVYNNLLIEAKSLAQKQK